MREKVIDQPEIQKNKIAKSKEIRLISILPTSQRSNKSIEKERKPEETES